MDKFIAQEGIQRSTKTDHVDVELTKDQAAALEQVMAWCVFHQPFFAHLLLSELPVKPALDIPIAATDQWSIFINPTTFFKYDLPEQAFILFHEVMHCVLGDPSLMQSWATRGSVRVDHTEFKFEPHELNVAMDLVINAQLIKGKCGRFNRDWIYDSNYSAEGNEAMVDLYGRLLHEKKNKKKPPNGSGFDVVLRPGAKQTEPAKQKERDPVQWAGAIASAAQAAEMQDKLPSNLKRLIGEALEPKVSWQEYLRATMMRVSGSDGLDWQQPDRRQMSRSAVGYDNVFFGRPTGFGAGTVVVAVDTSGSIGDEQLKLFFGEMAGILDDLKPKEMVVMWCDAKVQRVDHLDETADLAELRAKGAPGGGGTSFVPVFKRIERMGLDPDMLVYLTDLFGAFPDEEPDYPVIWGCISDKRDVPFGEVVPIDD